jgi:hypothetical protein
MKKIIFVLLLLPSLSYSQFWRSISYGLTYSYDICYPIFDSDVHPYDTLNYYGNGFSTGLHLLKPLNQHVSIESGFIFQNHSYGSAKYHYPTTPFYVTNTLVTDYSYENTYKFLSIPLGIRYYFNGDRISVFTGCGLIPALLTTHIEKHNYYNDDKMVLRSFAYLDDAERFNISGQVNAGLSIFLSYYTRVDLVAGYKRSFMPVLKNTIYEEYMHSFGFTFCISQIL